MTSVVLCSSKIKELTVEINLQSELQLLRVILALTLNRGESRGSRVTSINTHLSAPKNPKYIPQRTDRARAPHALTT